MIITSTKDLKPLPARDSNAYCMNENFCTISVLKPTACLVGKTSVTSPLVGATTIPSSGSIAIPLPLAPEAKTSSEHFQFNYFAMSGLEMISCLISLSSFYRFFLIINITICTCWFTIKIEF